MRQLLQHNADHLEVERHSLKASIVGKKRPIWQLEQSQTEDTDHVLEDSRARGRRGEAERDILQERVRKLGKDVIVLRV